MWFVYFLGLIEVVCRCVFCGLVVVVLRLCCGISCVVVVVLFLL